MEIKQIRYQNLLKIRDEQANGNWTELAENVGSAANYFYQLKPNGKRGLGSQLARRIEGKYGKPKGWMDTRHDAEGNNQAEGGAAEQGSRYANELSNPSVNRELLARCITEVEKLLLEMKGSIKSEPTPEQKASAISALYINRSTNNGEVVAKSDTGSVFAMLVSNYNP